MNRLLVFIIFSIFGLIGKYLIDHISGVTQNGFLFEIYIFAFICALGSFIFVLYKKGYGVTFILRKGPMNFLKTTFPISPYVDSKSASVSDRKDMRAIIWFWIGLIIATLLFIFADQIRTIIGLS